MSAFDRMVDPEVREVRRLEVITGALGAASVERRSKARIVAESLAPGVMMSEAAGRHDPRPQQLFAWRHQARQGRLALPNRFEKETPMADRGYPISLRSSAVGWGNERASTALSGKRLHIGVRESPIASWPPTVLAASGQLSPFWPAHRRVRC